MSEEPDPLTDKALESRKLEENKINGSNGRVDIEKTGNSYNNATYNNNGNKSDARYQSPNRYSNQANVLNDGTAAGKFEVPKPKYPKKIVNCDMEIESLE